MNPNSSTSDRSRLFLIVAVCFLLSGFAALLYETVWLRQFAILLGTSEQALAIVLASYMGGLALGAALAARFVDRIRRPLLTYGLLELGIAVAALLVPLGLTLVRQIQLSMFGGLAEPPAAGGFAQGTFTFGAAFGLIVIPTGLMGATLPLLARFAVHNDREVGPRIGMLYAINTLGAVLGTLTAAFICLPRLGLAHTTWVGAAVNVAVFLLVVFLVRGRQTQADETEKLSASRPSAEEKANEKQEASKPSGGAGERWILLLIAISGAASFCYEIIFTRMLGHVFGGSVYSFATMLAGFLLGIALGGAIASRIAIGRRQAAVGFAYAQSLIAIAALVAFRSVDSLAATSTQNYGSDSMLWLQVSGSILALLPTATCIGATFPLAIRIFARDQSDAASGSAQVYSWNVIGGIVGAMLTGILLLPILQYHGATIVAVIVNLGLALATVLVFKIGRQHLVVAGIGLLLLGLTVPQSPAHVTRVSALRGLPTQGQVLYNHVGKSAAVTVFYNEGEVKFQTNGLPEASLMPRDSGYSHLSDSKWLTALPPLLRPETKSMLVVGLGGGSAVEETVPSLTSIDVIELEPSVVEANRRVASLRTNDPLSDPRIRIILNDGRNALALTEKRYDAIVSQPSHPWTAGASHLYTREFAEVVRPRLNSGGVFLQWMSSQFVDADLVSSMGATLLDVFPHVRLYQPQAEMLLFVASDQPIRPEALPAQPGVDPAHCLIPKVNREYYRRLGVVTKSHLLSALSLDRQGIQEMCKDAPLILDERNLLAMNAPALTMKPATDDAVRHLESFTPLHRGIEAMRELCPTFDLIAYGQRINVNQRIKFLRETLLSATSNPADRAFLDVVTTDDSLQQVMTKIVSAQKIFPDDPRFAFMVLNGAMLGKLDPITDDQRSELKTKLTKAQASVVAAIQATTENNLAATRRMDAVKTSLRIRLSLIRPSWPESPGDWRRRLMSESCEVKRRSASSIATLRL